MNVNETKCANNNSFMKLKQRSVNFTVIFTPSEVAYVGHLTFNIHSWYILLNFTTALKERRCFRANLVMLCETLHLLVQNGNKRWAFYDVIFIIISRNILLCVFHKSKYHEPIVGLNLHPNPHTSFVTSAPLFVMQAHNFFGCDFDRILFTLSSRFL